MRRPSSADRLAQRVACGRQSGVGERRDERGHVQRSPHAALLPLLKGDAGGGDYESIKPQLRRDHRARLQHPLRSRARRRRHAHRSTAAGAKHQARSQAPINRQTTTGEKHYLNTHKQFYFCTFIFYVVFSQPACPV